jgi:hypothetical protein
MVSVKLTQGVGKNILTWGLGSVVQRVYQAVKEWIRMNSTITRLIKMVSNN